MAGCALLLLLAIASCWAANTNSLVHSLSPSVTAPPPAPSLLRASPPPPPSTASSVPAFPVSSASDLALAFQSRASLIYLMNNITLTNDVFPSNLSLTIGLTKNITIAPSPNLTTTVILDFGYFLTERVSIASSGVLNIQNLQLVNYYFPSLDATPTDTFLPFFSVLPGAIVNCTAVRFQIDPARCAATPNYASSSNSLRVPWLASEHPELLSWQTLDANDVQVNTARAPQNFLRINTTYVQAASGTGDIEMSSVIFLCATSLLAINDNSSDLYTTAATSSDLLFELEQLDSRTIYIENNVTVPIGAWSMTQVIANYRQVVLQSALPDLPDSPGNDTMPSQLYLQDSSDVLEAGYGGNLTFADLNLLFDSVCCSSQQILGSWYVNQQPLTGSLFNDLLPAALNALPVHIVGLAPPAFLCLQNVQLRYKQCDTVRFPRIANSLINALNANVSSNGNASYSDGHSVSCANCLIQGTAVRPANFSVRASYSTVQLINTTISCASFVSIAQPPALAPAPSLAMIEGGAGSPTTTGSTGTGSAAGTAPVTAASQRHPGFTPKAALVAPVIVVICAVVVVCVVGLWALLQRDYRKLQASYGHLLDQSASSEDSGRTDAPLNMQHKAARVSDR